MKSQRNSSAFIIFLLLLTSFAFKSHAQVNVGDSNSSFKKDVPALPPMASPQKVNEWIILAHELPYKELAGKGAFECRHLFVTKEHGDFNFKGYADTPEMAHARAGAVCIKRRCEMLDETIKRARSNAKPVSEAEYTEYLESLGKSPTEIRALIEQQKTPPDPNAPPTTCLNGTQDHRDITYISCFITPIECKKR